MFPDSLSSINTDTELGLSSIFTTNISNLKINAALPDSVLNPQYYLDKGFTVKTSQDNKDEKPAIQNIELTDKQIDLLFQTPLVKPSSDSIKLSEIEANFIFLDFWFLACKPCRESFPHLQEISEKYKDKGLEVIGINFHDTENKEYASKILKKGGILYSNLFSDRNLRVQLGVTSFPTFMIFDKNQKIVYVGAGHSEETEREIDTVLEGILNKE